MEQVFSRSILFLLITVSLLYPTHCLSLPIMTTDQQPPQKKQKVESDQAEGGTDIHVETSENLAPWASRWENKRIGFHHAEVNEVLTKHVDKLLPSTDKEEETKTCSNRRVFVPLCGKTVDMPYLVSMSYEVVGVEGIKQALEEFADEQTDLQVKYKGVKEGYGQYEGDKITLLRGDFFELDTSKAGGKFGAVYDRASLVAIEPQLRNKYVEIVGDLIATRGKVLLVVLERHGEEEATKKGPPYSIPETTARELFESQDWVETMTLLQKTDQLERNPEDRKRYEGLDKLMEAVYLIQAK